MKQLKDVQLAYLAAFIDCDGSILAQTITKPDYVLKHQIRLSVIFYQHSKRQYSLIKIQKELGFGNLIEKPNGISELSIIGQQNVEILLKAIQPFLRMKQKQASLVLNIIEQLQHTKKSAEKKTLTKTQLAENFLIICEKVDHVCDLNFSKSHSITTNFVKQRFEDYGWIEKK
jgi:hypothetical protein